MIWVKAAEMNFHRQRYRQGVLLAGHCLCRIRFCGEAKKHISLMKWAKVLEAERVRSMGIHALAS